MSPSKFIKSEVNNSVYTCGLTCSITSLCDGYTFNTENKTCSLYRIRELAFINENTTDTQLYLRQSGKVITNVIQQKFSYIWLNLVRLLLMFYIRYSAICDSIWSGYYWCYTTDTQLYLTQSVKVITHAMQQILSYIWLNLVRLLLMLYNRYSVISDSIW